jgi:hypothetical protein
MKRPQPPQPDSYGLQQFISDMLANAPVDRAAVWLRQAEYEFPQLAAEFKAGLPETPTQVINRMARHYKPAAMLHLSSAAKQFIARLQTALRGY